MFIHFASLVSKSIYMNRIRYHLTCVAKRKRASLVFVVFMILRTHQIIWRIDWGSCLNWWWGPLPMHQTHWSPDRPLPPPVSLTSQSHHEKAPEGTCTSRGKPGFPASTRERPRETFRLLESSTTIERQPYWKAVVRSDGHMLHACFGFSFHCLGGLDQVGFILQLPSLSTPRPVLQSHGGQVWKSRWIHNKWLIDIIF